MGKFIPGGRLVGVLIVGFPAGPWGTNCYVVAPQPRSECFIIDPGKDSIDGVNQAIAEHHLNPVAVVLSHGHLDHMWSVTPICDARDVPAYIHAGDRALLADPMRGISGETRAMFESMTKGSMTFSEPSDVHEVVDGQPLQLAGVDFTVAHAPGHTPGSVTYNLEAGSDHPPIMFSGDLLFAGSIGRTDLPGGDMNQMMGSLARVVLPCPDEMAVLPGHGPTTTIGTERQTNPYLRQVAAGTGSAGTPSKGL